MATPPAEPDPRPNFEKLPSRKSPSALHSRSTEGKHAYGDESRREDWIVAGVLLATLAVGGWLIFSGLV